jgi:ABC-type transport system involved in cytochrome c biogenesis ATPase subunit
MYLDRHLAIPLLRAAQDGEPILVQGPRGSGKTTLLRREFSGHIYVTLEDAADRSRARRDPAAFLARLRGPAVMTISNVRPN